MGAGEQWHGTAGGYCNHGCRCADCRKAWSEYMIGYKARLRAAGLPDGDRRHGTATGYMNFGCRCQPCRGWRSGYERARKRVA